MIAGKIDGYKVCNITKKMVADQACMQELESVEKAISQELEVVLANKGCAYGLKKDDILKMVYIFENHKQDKENIWIFKKALYTSDVKDQKEQFEKVVLGELKEQVNWGKCVKVIWNDIEIEPKRVQGFPKFNFSICMMLGIVYGIIFDNIGMGVCLGVAMGMCFEAVTKKKSNK